MKDRLNSGGPSGAAVAGGDARAPNQDGAKDTLRLVEAQELIPLIREAGEGVLSVYRRQFEYSLKDDGSPVTEADRLSHRIIVEGLRRIAPSIPVLSEESLEVPYCIRKSWEYYFLVDPLDGTREFVNRNGEFTVNIALVHRDTPVLGLIHQPAEGFTYVAEKGCGAFRLNGAKERLPLEGNSERFRVVLSRLDSSAEDFLCGLPAAEVRRLGSSLKFCAVAEGRADFYPRMIPSKEWDTAAGFILVRESGGCTLQVTGEPLSYNREVMVHPSFCVFGSTFIKKAPSFRNLLEGAWASSLAVKQ